MKNKIISAKKLTLDIDKIYKNDFNLIKIIAQTKKMRHNNKTLEAHKNNLKELMTEINSEYILNNNTSRKNLSENNNNFHNEYELFNKRASKKETKVIFKDLCLTHTHTIYPHTLSRDIFSICSCHFSA